jgi:hypothetical protein
MPKAIESLVWENNTAAKPSHKGHELGLASSPQKLAATRGKLKIMQADNDERASSACQPVKKGHGHLLRR